MLATDADVYTPGPVQTSIALPDKPAKDAITLADPDTGPPPPEQVTKPLLSNVTNGGGDDSVQVAEERTCVVPLLYLPRALSCSVDGALRFAGFGETAMETR